MVSKILVPETGVPKTAGNIKVEIPNSDVNLVDAAARGATEGIHLVINVAGMLIAFIALVALVNGILGFLHDGLESLAQRSSNEAFLGTLAHYFPSSLQQILGLIFQPIAWTMGISWKDSYQVGNLLGTRMVLNEVISFLQLEKIRETLDPRSFMISTFALCGFANFGSIAIQVGGIGALAPTRRHDLAALGFKAMIAGTLANFLSATIAGLVS
jgi:CNT family concentrative nucleoside transporter